MNAMDEQRRYRCGRDNCWIAKQCLYKTSGVFCWESRDATDAYKRRPLARISTYMLQKELAYRGVNGQGKTGDA